MYIAGELIKHASEKELTLCGCESCLWFLCVRSRGWLQRIVTPSPRALSASALQTQEMKQINTGSIRIHGRKKAFYVYVTWEFTVY